MRAWGTQLDVEKDEFASFVLAKTGSDRRDAKTKLLEVGAGNVVWISGGGEVLKGPRAVDDIDAVFCREGESGLVMAVRVYYGESNVIKAWAA